MPHSMHCAHNIHCFSKQAMATYLSGTVALPKPTAGYFGGRVRCNQQLLPRQRNQLLVWAKQWLLAGSSRGLFAATMQLPKQPTVGLVARTTGTSWSQSCLSVRLEGTLPSPPLHVKCDFALFNPPWEKNEWLFFRL